MRLKIIVIILLAYLVVGIVAGGIFNSIKKESFDVKTVMDTFPREGRLEVLSASVEINTSILKGEKNNADYFYIYTSPGTAIYSVDLSKIEIDYIIDSNKVLIGIPNPDFVLYVNEEDGEKVFEYQKHNWTGTAEDGYNTFIETKTVSYNDMVEAMNNNQELIEMAKESAKSQITNISKSMLPDNCTINTYFLD